MDDEQRSSARTSPLYPTHHAHTHPTALVLRSCPSVCVSLALSATPFNRLSSLPSRMTYESATRSPAAANAAPAADKGVDGAASKLGEQPRRVHMEVAVPCWSGARDLRHEGSRARVA
jgi:hypothetical protein